jgi:hypothetical protein
MRDVINAVLMYGTKCGLGLTKPASRIQAWARNELIRPRCSKLDREGG